MAIVLEGETIGVLGKIVVIALLAVPAGIAISLIRHPLTEAVGGALFLAGSAALGFALLLVVALLIEGVLFRSPDRWTRFN